MKILVTGGAGFIGSHIVIDLINSGHEVIVYDNYSTGLLENLGDYQTHCQIIKGDILDFDSLNKAFNKCDVISHHAAQLEIFRSTDDPTFDLNVNTIGTLNVLKAAKHNNVQKVINISSACIYGQTNSLTSEEYLPRPNWAYGVSKLAAEKYCDIYNNYYGLPVTNLRYGIVYGENEWYRRVLTIFIKRIINNQTPVVFGNGTQVRDFIYVGDVVRMNRICLENPKSNGQTYNVGTGKPTTIVELAQAVIKASGKQLEVIYEDIKEGEFSKLIPEKRRNTQELKMMLLDITKAKKELDWIPQVEIVEGLKREIDWLEDNPQRFKKILYSA